MIKEDSPRAVRELQNMGIRVVMLTGDNERTARAIGAQAGVDEVIAGVPSRRKRGGDPFPERERGKRPWWETVSTTRRLLQERTWALPSARVRISPLTRADVVLMKSRLLDVPAAIRLSRATLRNIHENLFWAFIYNVIGIPLAAGIWYPLFGWELNPMFGAAGHEPVQLLRSDKCPSPESFLYVRRQKG